MTIASLLRNVLLDFSDPVTLVLSSILLLVLTLIWYTRDAKENYPPGPYGLPIVGYIPFLGKEPFKTIDNLAKKYGNVFSMSFGKTPLVWVNDYESLKEAYLKTELLDRPPGLFDSMPGGGGFVGGNGHLWLEQRRFTMKIVRNLGIGKGPWETAIADEAIEFVEQLRRLDGKLVDIRESLHSSVTRNILSLLLAKPIEESSPINKLIMRFVNSGMHVVDLGAFYFNLPGNIYKWLLKLGMCDLKKHNETIEEFQRFVLNEINERKKDTSYHDSDDFIGSYLEEMQKKEDEDDTESTFSTSNLFGNITAMIMGGSDTTKTSLLWLFVAMIKNPDIQNKIYEELKSVLVEKKIANWEDRAKLPWMYASIMESQRWKSLAPLGVMRLVSEDTQIGGYDIPKGTSVMPNLWALHNDNRYWKNPEKYDPTRFFKSDGTLNFKPDSYAPFSIGRRNCPGESIALMEIVIYFSAIMRNFEVKAAVPAEKFHVDAILGQTLSPSPYKLRFIARS